MSQRDNIHQGIAGLNPYQPGKPIDELARELGLDDIVKLASNENPRGPSTAVVEALNACTADLTRYPDGGGFVLKQALAAHLGVGMDQLTLGNGSNDVLDLIARLTLEPGYQAIVAEHCFIVYPIVTCYAGAELVVTEELVQGALEHEHLEDLSDVVPEVEVAEPIVGPPQEDESHITYYDDVETEVRK